MEHDGRVPLPAPGCEPSASAGQEAVFAESHPSREHKWRREWEREGRRLSAVSLFGGVGALCLSPITVGSIAALIMLLIAGYAFGRLTQSRLDWPDA